MVAREKEQAYGTRLKDVAGARAKEALQASLKTITAAVNGEKGDEESPQLRSDTEDCETDTENIAESGTSSDVYSASGSVLGARPKVKRAAPSTRLVALV